MNLLPDLAVSFLPDSGCSQFCFLSYFHLSLIQGTEMCSEQEEIWRQISIISNILY